MPKKKKMRTMDLILIILGITTLAFMGIVISFSWFDKVIPDSLIYSYFTAIGVEGTVMGWIKTRGGK